jgi:hypothetical protein
MKRILTGAAVSAALLAPAIADAARTNYTGKLIGISGSSVKLKESRTAAEHNVTSFAVRDFEAECKGDLFAIVRRTRLAGEIEISERGRFKVADDNGKTLFKVNGEIRRNKAFGTFRYSGKIPVSDGTGNAECDSGRIEWVARP